MAFDKKKYLRRYYLLHKEESRKYILNHKEKIKKYKKKYSFEHKKEINAQRKKYRHKLGISKTHNTGIRKKRIKTSVSRLIGNGISYTKEYRRIAKKGYKKRMKKAGYLKIADIRKVYNDNLINNGGILRCIYCHREITMKEATLEHKQPISRGGTNAKENLAIACGHCNWSKNNKTEEEFKEYILERKEE